MTLPAYAQEIGARLPSANEKEAANQLRAIIASQPSDETSLITLKAGDKQAEIALTPALSSLLLELLRHVGRGDAVTLVPVSQMLTTQQAADILNVSRPFFISLLEREKIRYEMVGRHRRIRAQDLFAYKTQRDQERANALEGLASMDAEFL